jgi:hypothetical protein
LETPLAALVALVVVAELSVMNWKLFGDIFVCQAPAMPLEERQDFATRVRTTAQRDPRMMSYLYPFLMSNTGVLEGYENLAVPRGLIRLEGQPGYRGECYLEKGTASAEIENWSMSRVTIAVSAPSADNVVLNQNFSPGWRATVSGENEERKVEVSANSEGLVSTPVEPGDSEVEFRYLPKSFVWGAWVSGLSLVICGVVWMAPKALFRQPKSSPLEKNLSAQGQPE